MSNGAFLPLFSHVPHMIFAPHDRQRAKTGASSIFTPYWFAAMMDFAVSNSGVLFIVVPLQLVFHPLHSLRHGMKGQYHGFLTGFGSSSLVHGLP